MLMLLASAPAFAAELSPPVVKSAVEVIPAPKQVAGAERKPIERKPGEAPKGSRDTQKPPLPALEEKDLGLGCAKD
ncbi:MAG: hypothetical protein NDI67_01310 [Sulfuritalea sp.]|nr:hypothetical protein [Sulfuritalea sp.]